MENALEPQIPTHSGGLGVLAVDTLRAASVASPLVAFGLLLGGGHPVRIMNALLFLGNLICVNLGGVTPFLVQGIHPANRCENGLAVKATRVAIGLWVAVLGGMILMIFLLCRAGYARIK